MIRKIDGMWVSSENAKRLASFYRDIVGLKVTMEAQMGEGNDMVYGFNMKGGSDFTIMDDAKIKGKTKEPGRYTINFEVDDIEAEVRRMKKAKAKRVADIYHIEDYGHVATFEDPDGNYFQFVQVRAN